MNMGRLYRKFIQTDCLVAVEAIQVDANLVKKLKTTKIFPISLERLYTS